VDVLPIDEILPDVAAALRAKPSLVIEAPPGAGKTTRVPRAILEAGLAGRGEVLVLEPRRLAARLAARRVAEEMGERLGGTVGYQVRFEDVSSAKTRLRYLTEGLLTRRLLSDPTLRGVGAVVIDEFHERHLPGDIALALLARLQRTRPELKLVVMSATLDAEPVAAFLSATRLRSEGRRFEVKIDHLPEPDDRHLDEQVASALRRLLREGLDGDVLVFLPGAAEIRRAQQACAQVAEGADVEIHVLHGDLSPEEQDRAIRPGRRRKVILSTNVAETSVTIEGVTAVVDSGLARIASHSPWSGLPILAVKKVSQASAAQRAGRAGRLRPGRALRLYTRHDHDSRPLFEAPEIARLDLAEAVLAFAAAGAEDTLWFEPPPPAALEAARTLLVRLGALDAAGRVTARGKELLRFPVHPRLGRFLLEAEGRGVAEQAALLAAIVGERDIRTREGSAHPPTGPSDLLELGWLFEEAERSRFSDGALRSIGLSPGPVQAVDRARRQLARAARRDRSPPKSDAEVEEALLACTAVAFPDRVGRRRSPGSPDVVLVGGGSARLAPSSVVREAPLLVAVDVEERKGDRPRMQGQQGGGRGSEVTLRIASAVTEELLFDLFADRMRYADEVTWNAQAERVDAFTRLFYEDLVIEESRARNVDPEQAAALLFEQAAAKGARVFAEEGELDGVLGRIGFIARAFPEKGLAVVGEADVKEALRSVCVGCRSFAGLREASLAGALLGRLTPEQAALVAQMAPERLTLPGGRSVKIHYELGEKPPWAESRLQDFFGMVRAPALAGGRVPLVLHLLAPNHRAVQVTTDLAGFWDRHYPAIRKELSRRYPRHAWPEDPRTAAPPVPRKR
jgi:ATP-dependent helicase HrpB